MFSPVVILFIAAASVTVTVKDTSAAKGFPTEQACTARLAQIVENVKAIQQQIPTQSKLMRAECMKG